MKKFLPALLLLAAAAPLILADSASVWATLDIQVSSMAQAVQDKNVPILEELDHVVTDEVSGLRRDPTLPQSMAPLFTEIAKQASATFHAAKDNDWKSAAADQAAFAQAVKQAEAAAAPGAKKE